MPALLNGLYLILLALASPFLLYRAVGKYSGRLGREVSGKGSYPDRRPALRVVSRRERR
ncbi:MAG: hypothetical protein U0835_07030 [Isosphaeraceae bacterium]